MTFADLYGEDLSRLLSSTDTQRLFTTVRRKAAINAAAEWFVTQTECVQRVVPFTLADGDASVNLRTLTEGIEDRLDVLWMAKRGPNIQITAPSGQITTIAGRDFPRTAEEILDRDVPGWRQEGSSTPRNWYLVKDGGDTLLAFTPAIKISAGYAAVLNIPYVARPATMVADDETPLTVADGEADLTLTPWHDAISLKAASELEMLRKDLNRSNQLMQMAMARVMDYRDAQRVPGGKRVQMPRYRTRSQWGAPRAVRETETI